MGNCANCGHVNEATLFDEEDGDADEDVNALLNADDL